MGRAYVAVLEFSHPDHTAHDNSIDFTPEGMRLIITHHHDVQAQVLDTRTSLKQFLRSFK